MRPGEIGALLARAFHTAHLGLQEHVLRLARPVPGPDGPLALAAAVHVRGVDRRNTEVARRLEPRHSLLAGEATAESRRRAPEPPDRARTEDEFADFDGGFSECDGP